MFDACWFVIRLLSSQKGIPIKICMCLRACMYSEYISNGIDRCMRTAYWYERRRVTAGVVSGA